MTIEEKKAAVLTALEGGAPLTIGQVAAACPFGETIAGDTLRELAEERRIVADLGRPRRYSLPAVESPATVTPPTDRERTEALFAEMSAALAAEPGDVMLLEGPSANRITNDGLAIREELGLDVTASTCAVIDALDDLKARAKVAQFESEDDKAITTICVALGVDTLPKAVGKVGELQRALKAAADIKTRSRQDVSELQQLLDSQQDAQLRDREQHRATVEALVFQHGALATHFARLIAEGFVHRDSAIPR